MKILLSPDTAIAPATGAAPPNTPAAAPDKPEASTENVWMADLDKQMAEPTKPDKAKAPEKAPDKPAADPKDKKPDAEKKDQAPADKDKAAAADPKADKVVISTGPKALREQLEKKQGEVSTLSKQLEEARGKLKSFESKAPEQTKVVEQLAAITKERDTFREQLRIAKREHSPDFVEKYDKPWRQSAGFAKQLIESMQITEGEEGPDQKTRQATWEDFRQLYSMPVNKAAALSRTMFGDASPAIVQQIVELKKLEAAREIGTKEESEYWDKHDKESAAKSASDREQHNATWAKLNTDLIEKHPEWAESPDDKELNEVRGKSYELIDKAFSSDATGTMTPLQRITLDAHIRHRAANYPVMKLKYDRAIAELDEARAKIEELESAGPTKTNKPGGEQSSTNPASWEEDLEKTMS